MRRHSSESEVRAIIRRYFEADWVFAGLGHPFGDRVDLAKALQACALLRR
jgi:hypothetical protein